MDWSRTKTYWWFMWSFVRWVGMSSIFLKVVSSIINCIYYHLIFAKCFWRTFLESWYMFILIRIQFVFEVVCFAQQVFLLFIFVVMFFLMMRACIKYSSSYNVYTRYYIFNGFWLAYCTGPDPRLDENEFII